MKFKTWLAGIEEGIQRSKPQGGMSNQDMTTGLGPTSHFGGQRAMLPISYGFDNRAFAGVVDAVGSARSKIRARKGAEPGVASQYGSLEDIRKDPMQTVNMPLQVPADWRFENNGIIYSSKGLIAQMKSSFGDTLKSQSLYNVDEEGHLRQPSGQPATRLYLMTKGVDENPSELESAINYTTALMQASITTNLSQYSHLLNLERPIIKDRKILPFPLESSGGQGPQRFYKNMMCAFVFKARGKDSDIGDDIHSQIDSIVQQKTNAPHQTSQNQAGSSARQRSRLAAARRSGGAARQTMPINRGRP